MEPYDYDLFRNNLLDKRQAVQELLEGAPAEERRERLGPNGRPPAEAHLDVLETAVEEADEQTLGLCQVCHLHVDRDQLEIDYTAHICIDHLSADERRQLEFELELSQEVQRALLPRRAPAAAGLDVAAFSRPAQIVGGDFFDFFRFADGAFGLAIADVAGHGMASGLLMASLQTALRALAPATNSPGDLAESLNDFFIHNIRFTSFVTLFLGKVEPALGRLTYTNAGHNPPLLYCEGANGRGPISWLEPTGPAIGLAENYFYAPETIEVTPGDSLILYTDGVTEALDGGAEEFGQGRLAEAVIANAGLPARELVSALRLELERFSGDLPLADDTTIVACRFSAGGA
ncbi:MAG: PP2C family protein-serine/threonine phosphatase [Candidatus Promineifilaceae bacterium]